MSKNKKSNVDQLLAEMLANHADKSYRNLVKEVMKKHIKLTEEGNSPHSHYELGRIYHLGKDGIHQNLEKAYEHYQIASDHGHPVAPYYLCQMIGSHEERRDADKIRFISQSHHLIDIKVRLLIKAAACGAYCKAEQKYSYYLASSKLWQDGINRYKNWLEEQIRSEEDQAKLGRWNHYLGFIAYKKGTVSGLTESRQYYLQAYRYFSQGGKFGCAASYYYLGYWLYRLKIGYDGHDYKEKAEKYLYKAAQHGHIMSKLLIIKDYRHNYSTELIVDYLTASSSFGFSIVMYYLAILYFRGVTDIILRNYPLALDYLKFALVNSDIETFPFPTSCMYYSLGLMYHYGLGIHHHYNQASYYYYLALQKNNDAYSHYAAWQIGKLIQKRRLSSCDDIQVAIGCYRRARLINQFYGYGCYRLAKLILKSPQTLSLTEDISSTYYFKLAMKCSSLSPYYKGLMYEYGLGIDVDLTQARTFYTNAIEKDGLFCDIYTAHLADKARQKMDLIQIGK
ncbi:hypothetical protein TrispH2_010865 [Trichoplax sp. H2]|nr:hypothetical protein TrispH2_010865 [Trichoplax sp. H2]|eukprot:RDD36809.1 hypothetical protein TrispH2_010865 [Trichoplax sp. H2]